MDRASADPARRAAAPPGGVRAATAAPAGPLARLQRAADASPKVAALAALARAARGAPVLQRVLQAQFERLRRAAASQTTAAPWADPTKTTVIIEVMVPRRDFDTAKTMIDRLEDPAGARPLNVAIAIGLNAAEDAATGKGKTPAERLAEDTATFLAHARGKGVRCTVVPMLWTRPERKATDTADPGGYVFPFLEARSTLGRDPNTLALAANASERVFHRLMDADVTNDPLFEGRQQDVANVLNDPDRPATDIVTGGYDWSTAGLEDTPRQIVELLNRTEHMVREKMAQVLQRALYAPEPNTYVPADIKKSWDLGQKSALKSKEDYGRQMGESMHGRRGVPYAGLSHVGKIATTKPRKDWLANLDPVFEAVRKGERAEAIRLFTAALEDIHQSYLNVATAEKIAQGQGEPLDGKTKQGLSNSLAKIKKATVAEFEGLLPEPK